MERLRDFLTDKATIGELACPFDGRLCTRVDCEDCQVKIDAMVTIREGENIEDHWRDQNSGAE